MHAERQPAALTGAGGAIPPRRNVSDLEPSGGAHLHPQAHGVVREGRRLLAVDVAAAEVEARERVPPGEAAVDDLHVACAWTFTGLRIVHSCVQATIDVVPIRFGLFVLSWVALGTMIVRALIAAF